MFKIICGGSIGIEDTSYRLAREYGFKTEGYYIDFENQNFIPTEGDGMIQMSVMTKQKEKVIKNIEKSDITIVLRRQQGGNSPNVDLTIGYCKCEKWKKEFNFHQNKTKFRHCIVVMDAIGDNADISSIETDLKRVVDYIKLRKLKSIFITGHIFHYRSVSSAKFEEKVETFLVSLFSAFKELFLKPSLDFIREENSVLKDTSSSLFFEQSTLGSSLFTTASPQTASSPTTPSSAKRLLTPVVETVKAIDTKTLEDSSEIMKREILAHKRSSSSLTQTSYIPLFLSHVSPSPIPSLSPTEEYPLEKRILDSLSMMEDDPFPKRSRLD